MILDRASIVRPRGKKGRIWGRWREYTSQRSHAPRTLQVHLRLLYPTAPVHNARRIDMHDQIESTLIPFISISLPILLLHTYATLAIYLTVIKQQSKKKNVPQLQLPFCNVKMRDRNKNCDFFTLALVQPITRLYVGLHIKRCIFFHTLDKFTKFYDNLIGWLKNVPNS